jgi:predicted RNase H-like HicB family nuclease
VRQVILYPGEDGFWIAECPSLPGCVTQGKTREEAIVNIKEAIRGYVATLEDDHLPVPEEHLLFLQKESRSLFLKVISFIRLFFVLLRPAPGFFSSL